MIKRKGYLCGPTLYSTPHIGNLKTFYTSIKHFYNNRPPRGILLMNYTDIGDKIYDNVKAEESTLDYINYYARKTTDLLKQLELKPWVLDIHRASFNIKKICKDIKRIEKDPRWKILRDEDGVRAVLQMDIKEGFKWHKNNIDFPDQLECTDFCMWRGNKYPLFKLDSSAPLGIPGWHNECASLVHHYCDKSFTHYGGIDLKQLHHKNESDIFSTLGEYTVEWVHVQPICLSLDGKEKISKSKKTGVEIQVKDCKKWIPFLDSLSIKKVNIITPEFPLKEKILKVRSYMRSKREIMRYYYKRINARSHGNYRASDILREKLKKLGVTCRDTKNECLMYY